MKKLSALGLLILAIALSATSIFAANTAHVLGGGVCINEVLPDPSSATANTDTDGNGIASDPDEFVELFNLSGVDIDISGWQLWDAGTDMWFQFPGIADDGTTILKAGAYALVLGGVQAGGSLPTMTNPDSLAFDAGRSSDAVNNGGDNVVLYDPGADEYVQLLFNNDTADNPPVDYAGDGFSVTATRVGSIEDIGSDVDGKSMTRYPSGDTNVVIHDAIPGTDAYASPNKVTVNSMNARGISPVLAVTLVSSLTAGLVMLKRRKLQI